MAKDKVNEPVNQSLEMVEEPATKTQSAKDLYNSRVKAMSPDLDMENEDDYYNQANKRLDDYEALNTGVGNLNKVMDDNPYFAEMLAQASKQKDFNPVLFLVENGHLDLDALRDDEEYAQKISEAQAKWLDKNTKAKELEDKIATNLPASIDECKNKGKELGLSDEQVDEVINKYFSLLDDIEQGVLSADIFELLAKGTTYDADVASAEEQGKVSGRAQKVRETLNTMPKTASRSGGSQPRGAEPSPANKKNTMFGL